MPHMTTKNQNSHMAIPGAHIRAGRGSKPVGRQGPETSPKCWYMYGPCWATAISKLMFPKNMLGTPPLRNMKTIGINSKYEVCYISDKKSFLFLILSPKIITPDLDL